MNKYAQIDTTLDNGDLKETSICVLGINMNKKNVCIWAGQLMGEDRENSLKNNEWSSTVMALDAS